MKKTSGAAGAAVALLCSFLIAAGDVAWATGVEAGLGAAPGGAAAGGGPGGFGAKDGSFDEVCGPVLAKGEEGTKNNEGATQKLQYCQAADSAEEAASANSMMWKVWAGVAAVCMYACVASFVGGPTSEYLCMGVTVAGGVTDAIITKEFTTALTAIAGAGVGYVANMAVAPGAEAATQTGTQGAQGAQQGTQTATEGAKKQKDIGACLNAAMAGLQTYMKYNTMQTSEDSYKKNFELAKKVDISDAQSIAQGGGQGPNRLPASAGSDGTAEGGSAPTTTGESAPAPVASSSSSPCSAARSGQAVASSFISCATAVDTNIPRFVNNPKFPKEFQKASGIPLPDFFAKASRPTQALAAGMGGGLNRLQAGKLSAVLQAVERRVDNNVDGATYAGGGGGMPSGGGEADPGLGEMMQGILGQLMPGEKKKEDGTGVNTIAFGQSQARRMPAATAEDRRASIFDRVSNRYYFVGRRMLEEGQP